MVVSLHSSASWKKIANLLCYKLYYIIYCIIYCIMHLLYFYFLIIMHYIVYLHTYILYCYIAFDNFTLVYLIVLLTHCICAYIKYFDNIYKPKSHNFLKYLEFILLILCEIWSNWNIALEDNKELLIVVILYQ